MVKRRGVVILLWILVGISLGAMSWSYLSYQENPFMKGIIGNSVKDVITTFYETSSINQRIFILSQILLFVIIAVVAFVLIRKFRKRNTLLRKDYVASGNNKRSRTDLDVLYEMLKKKKEVEVEDIERAFRIKPEVALGWSKILEDGNLAEIDYPRFGKPILKLIIEDMNAGGGLLEKKEDDKCKKKASNEKKKKGKKLNHKKIVAKKVKKKVIKKVKKTKKKR